MRKLYNSVEDMRSNKMTVNFDVLGALMKYRVISDLYGTSIIGIEWSGTMDRHTKFAKELSKIDHLTTNGRHGSVLSFSRRFGDHGLLFGFL